MKKKQKQTFRLVFDMSETIKQYKLSVSAVLLTVPDIDSTLKGEVSCKQE